MIDMLLILLSCFDEPRGTKKKEWEDGVVRVRRSVDAGDSAGINCTFYL
jgi:hypothetical protein